MKVIIKGKSASFIDDHGTTITITIVQLFEMSRLLSLAVKEDKGLLFETLEFTV